MQKTQIPVLQQLALPKRHQVLANVVLPSNDGSSLQYNSQLLEQFGCYFLGAGYHRPYSPSLGIFLSPDTESPFGYGGINAYAYCAGDPINRVDPTGHFWIGLASLARLGRSVFSEGARNAGGVATKIMRPGALRRSVKVDASFSIQSRQGLRTLALGDEPPSMPVSNIGGLKFQQDNFIDVAQAHGAPFVAKTDRLVTGGKLASQIRSVAGQSHKFKRLELQICCSASGGRFASNAQRVADKLQVPTTGFHGGVLGAESLERSQVVGVREIFEPQTGLYRVRTKALNASLGHVLRAAREIRGLLRNNR